MKEEKVEVLKEIEEREGREEKEEEDGICWHWQVPWHLQIWQVHSETHWNVKEANSSHVKYPFLGIRKLNYLF